MSEDEGHSQGDAEEDADDDGDLVSIPKPGSVQMHTFTAVVVCLSIER